MASGPDPDQVAGMTLAGFLLSVVTLNNLRGLKLLTDEQVEGIYDEALQTLEEIQAVSGSNRGAVAVARRIFEKEIAREIAGKSGKQP